MTNAYIQFLQKHDITYTRISICQLQEWQQRCIMGQCDAHMMAIQFSFNWPWYHAEKEIGPTNMDILFITLCSGNTVDLYMGDAQNKSTRWAQKLVRQKWNYEKYAAPIKFIFCVKYKRAEWWLHEICIYLSVWYS